MWGCLKIESVFAQERELVRGLASDNYYLTVSDAGYVPAQTAT